MSNIDKQALRKAAMYAKTTDDWGCDSDNFHDNATPDAVLALLDELETLRAERDEFRSRLKLERAILADADKRIVEQVEIIAKQERWIKDVESTMIAATDRAEAAEKRIAQLEAREEALRPVGVMSEKAFHRLEGSESCFIALWPRPGIYLPRKRPEDGVIVYARTASADSIKGSE
jgi:hypothetical protein